jgi:ferredoxin-NADP reductase
MPTQWYHARVLKIEQLTAFTRQFTVEVPQDAGIFHFIPGQFITMDLPVSEKRLHRWRSYSIANRPDDTNILEFCIVRSQDGLGTKYLFEDISVGSELKFKGPDGGFVLPKHLDDEIIMLCTGTGVAPFRSMIQYLVSNRIPFRKIHLIFGTRTHQDILYREEFDAIQKENPSFMYSVALSREVANGFHHGYIHDIYLNEYKVVKNDRKFYICGWSKMIDEAVANLMVHLKYDKSQIHYELYG